jgi:uncharacterized protein YndB with AHSA1/START domain
MSDQIKYTLEFPVKASPKMLYQYLTTPSGLSEWFANDVNFRGEKYTFIWDNSEEEAKVLSKKNNVFMRLQWLDDEDEDADYYFEYRIEIDDLTNDVSLMVTDFAEEDELQESKLLWETQISNLLHAIGS